MAMSTQTQHGRMRLYSALSALRWPRSYYMKILVLCFVGTHIPLLATVVLSLLILNVPASTEVPIILIMLGGTVVAATATVFCVRAMLAPIAAVTAELERYRQTEEFTELPRAGKDEAASLMHSVNTLIRQFIATKSELETLSNMDALVGIGNRRWLLGKAEAILTKEANAWAPTTVALIDLDCFKAINDTCGHAVGDAVLKRLGEILTTYSRPTDLVGRLGGDEFCIIFLQCTVEEAAAAVERMRLALARTDVARAHGMTLSLSAGLTTRAEDGEDLDDTFARADRALYDAKAAGRDRIKIALAGQDTRH
ncbi:diguanylate cyclase (GGDEF)-like protein [Amorphus suaedae]